LQPDVTIVIPQHGRVGLSIAAIRALRSIEPVAWPIVVVDDGSPPPAAELVAQCCPEIRLLLQPHRGVTAAWNHALQAVTTPLVILLNNDVKIREPWVDRLLQPLRAGAAPLSGVELRPERALPPHVLAQLGRAEFVAGWCWAFLAEDARAIGGFDESLRMYFSDTDLQARLLRLRPNECEPAIIARLSIRHSGHASTRLLSNRRDLWERDRARFIAKWTQPVR